MGRYPSGPYGRDNDYDDELRAFSRKRELEKRIGGGRRKYSSSSDSEESSGGHRRKDSKNKNVGEDEDLDIEDDHSKKKVLRSKKSIKKG